MPWQIGIELAEDGASGRQPDVFGEAPVAAQIATLDVLPEHPQRQRVEHGLEQLARFAQARLGVREGGDVDMGADHAPDAAIAVALDGTAARENVEIVAVVVTEAMLDLKVVAFTL